LDIKEILSRLKKVQGGHGQWKACCPAHDDKTPSLSVKEGNDGRVLMHCHANCTLEQITAALGITSDDLLPDELKERRKTKTSYPPIVATYNYYDDEGKLLAQKLRREDKSFTWRRPDPNRKGDWIYNRNGVPRRLYVAGEISDWLCICEGEKDADNLHKLGYDAVSCADGASGSKWRQEYTEQLRGKIAIVWIFQDNDEPGKKLAQETAAALYGIASHIRVLDLSKVWAEIPEKGDVSDLIAKKGNKDTTCAVITELAQMTPDWEPPAVPVADGANQGEVIPTLDEEQQSHSIAAHDENEKQLPIISAPDLQNANLPPIKFIVEDILPEGTSLISAASKIGKSWMALDLGLCAAAGEPFLGHKTNQCGVLYLALEDSLNRLQNRMNKVLGGKPAPEQFYFATRAPKLDNSLLDALDDHLKKYPDIKLIIIDTLQKIRGQARPHESLYALDYREMETVKEFLEQRGASAIFVHHNRKMRDDSDPFNMISGTNGIMGAADTVWTITKDNRDDEEATLHIIGRDVSQSDIVIQFDKNVWRWAVVGEAEELAEKRARETYDNSPIVKTIKTLLKQSPEHRWDGTAKDLMEAGKYIANTYLASDNQRLGYAIRDLDKPLFEFDRIIHSTSKTGGTGGKKHSFYYQDLEPFEDLPEQEELPQGW